MTLNKQELRAQQLARDIADLIRAYEVETGYRVQGISIEERPALGMYDVRVRIGMVAESLDSFTQQLRQ